MARSYRQWVTQVAPPWLVGKYGARLLSAFAIYFDAIADSAHQAGAVNLLGAPTFPPDAAGYVGRERMMERYPGESDAQYQARLQGAWDAWTQAGTDRGVLDQLAALGLTGYIKESWAPTDLRPTPQPYQWNWDGDPENFSRFWVVVTGHPFTPRLWGDGSLWGGTSLWGAQITPPSTIDGRAVRRLINKWKPGHAICPYAVFVFDIAAWNANQPDGTWGDVVNRVHMIDTEEEDPVLVALYMRVNG